MLRIRRLCPGDLTRRIAAATRLRIGAGEITESGLAKLTHWSQPHLANVLAGRRSMPAAMADAIAAALGIDPLELYGQEQLLDWAAGVQPPFHRPAAAIAGAPASAAAA